MYGNILRGSAIVVKTQKVYRYIYVTKPENEFKKTFKNNHSYLY